MQTAKSLQVAAKRLKSKALLSAEKRVYQILGIRVCSIKRRELVSRFQEHLGLKAEKLSKPEATQWLLKWSGVNISGEELSKCSVAKSAVARPKATKKATAKSNYQEYLNSDLWNAIRRYVLLSASYQCKACGCPANQVHHTSYDAMTMRGRDISKLVALCKGCHQSIEFDESGTKMTLSQANERLERRMSRELDREFAEIVS